MLFPTTRLKYGTTLKNYSQKKEELFCIYYLAVTLKLTLSVPQYKYFSSFQSAERVLKKWSCVSVHQLSQTVPFLHSSFANMVKAWSTMLCSIGHIWPTCCLFNSLLFLNHVHYERTGRKRVNKNRKGCREFINSDHLISCKLKCMNSILLNTRINLKNLYWLNLHWYALE